MPEHYEGLKGNYQQLLDQFERSEAIRREQKELIGEQRTQMGYLEQSVKHQEEQMAEIAKSIEMLKMGAQQDQARQEQSMRTFDLSKINKNSG